jgi:2-iminobutanoate/2-iminopropanoate deaminase
MDRRIIRTNRAAPPVGAYSQAIAANGFLFISGQGPNTPAGERIGGPFAEQVKTTFDNLQAIAGGAGATLTDAVRVGVYLRDMSNFAELNELYRSRFARDLPARTTIQSDLPGFEIEIDAILLLPDREPVPTHGGN